MGFDGAFVEKPQMKAYDVEFSVQSTNNLMKMQEKEVEQVSTILGKWYSGGSDVLLGHRVNIGVIIIQINPPNPFAILQVYPVRIQPRYYATFDGTRKSSLNVTWRCLKRCCGMLVY